jgi:tetratricopeptide (TPR) repeat protein
MLRPLLAALLLLISAPIALAQSEADRQLCAKPEEPNPDGRIEACTRVLAAPNLPVTLRVMAHRSRGIAYGVKRLHELALVDFDEALKLEPRDRQALGLRGRALYHMGQYDRALAAFNELLRHYPRSDRAFNERGLVHVRKGDLDAALADYESAIKLNPKNVPARNNRALVFARQNKLDEAIAAYNEALLINPDYLLAYNNRARAYEAKGELESALTDYKHVAERQGPLKDEDDQRSQAAAKRELVRVTKVIAESKTAPAAAVAERRVALIIGNGAYMHVPALRNPVNDAKALAKALRGLGFSEVRELYDADLSALGRTLKDFGDIAGNADWAVIYYAGHGIEVGGTNYLIPVDARLEQQTHVEDEALPMTRLLGKVAAASKMQLVILDACRNNPFIGRMKRSGTRSLGRGLASIEPESGMLVAYAARDGTTALDGDAANSPYAEALIKHIAEPGLEISLLFRKVRDDVYTKTGRQQEPYTYGSLPAQPFYFKR